MAEKDETTYAKDMSLAITTTIGIAIVIAIIYVAFRALGWVGNAWG